MRAVIFDMDGVLIDSEPSWRAAQVSVLSELGVPIQEADCAATTGMRIDAVVRHWRGRHPWPDPLPGPDVPDPDVDAVVERIVSDVAARIRAAGRPLPGIMTAYRAVQHSGHADAIATSSPHAIIDAVVDRLHLGNPVVCSAMDEAAGKPDPAVYLTTARQLGLAPSQCLAIEDSEPGVQAARAAGMKVVAVEPVDGADWTIATHDLAPFLTSGWLTGR